MTSQLDTVELIRGPASLPLMFRVIRAKGYTFCIVPDVDLLTMDDTTDKYTKLAAWATNVAAAINLRIGFRVGLDGHSLDWESSKSDQIASLATVYLN